jgi:hypothetical protein
MQAPASPDKYEARPLQFILAEYAMQTALGIYYFGNQQL